MNARILLETIRGESIEVTAIQRKIAELKEKSFSVGGFDYGKERVVSNPAQTAPFENSSITAIDLLNKYNDRLNLYASRCDFIQGLIDRMTDAKEKSVLIERYLCALEWKDIIESLNEKERTVYNIHTRAINSLQAVIDEQERVR